MHPSTAPLGAGALDPKAVKASLLQLLEERHRQAEVWLQNHHDALRQAMEQAVEQAMEVALAEPEGSESMVPADADNIHTVPDKLTNEANHCYAHGGKSSVALSSAAGDSKRSLELSRQHGSRSSLGAALSQKNGPLWERITKEKKTTLLETGTGMLIVLNTLVMFVQLELDGRKGHAQFWEGEVPDTSAVEVFFLVLNHIFNAIFVVELFVKIAIFRGRYFQSTFDIFDLIIVLVTSVDLYVLTHLSQTTRNISFLRTMRLLRLARLLRTIRMMNFFQQLRVLMHTMVLSFLSVFWSMLILLLFMLVSSLLLSQLLQDFVVNGSENQTKTREWADRYYGTSSKSLYTVFEMTFSGCWPNYARELIEEVSPWFAAFFVPYVTLVIFTLIRLIYALLLKDTLQAAANDANLVVQDKMKEAKGLIKNLSDLFAEADTTQDGYLGREEFDRILAFPRVQAWMSALGLNTQDTEQLFSILDDGENPDGMISRKAFVNGIMRMKGHAQKQDLLVSARDTHRILAHCKTLEAEVTKLRILFATQQQPSGALTSSLTMGTVAKATV